ncbi:Protein-glutamine gamma-glutamyltransferase [Streptomyces sp. YIM 130001]|uniref:transglutaminase TgpA family protein n=1 Tax=Streptomyces sp. YIM 130001 TaxID=2259644 RepID=UPI000E653A95|nr:DUF3488 and transglutaminase-like domain-containing protein [Streptomyces sp. YIM 130001]RII18282.1 Protein-glutamine gamma-glutamyltransferase [Streptomyces sp. YIM 130001]
MSGSTRLALCATAATLLASCALLPLVDTKSWMVQAALFLCIQSAVGAVTRRIPLARPLTVAIQAAISLLILTAAFAQDAAIGGVLPSPEVFERFGLLLEAGGDDVGQYSIPAPLSDGIKLMLIGGVLIIGLLVDALAVTFRSAAPAGLPLLALYSVAAGLGDGGHGWLWFLLAASGFLLLLLAEGRDRLSQWGRVFGGGSRSSAPVAAGLDTGGAVAPIRAGRRIGVLALGIALVVPAALPAMEGGILDGAGKAGGSGSGGGTISAVNPLVSLQNSLNQPEDREVLTYRTDSEDTQDLYLRIVALDQFDGDSWKPSERRIYDVPTSFPTPPGLDQGVTTDTVRTNISAADWYAQDWLPMPYPANRVAIDGRWRFEPVGRTLVGDDGQTTRGKDYSVESSQVRPKPEQLAAAPEARGEIADEFTKVPDSLPQDVHDAARRVTRGASNDYERAVKIQDWFASEGGFTYDTEVNAGSGSAAISRFLKQKEGFCVHFSFSMAAMARTLGIPARVAVGFTPGAPESDGRMSVGLRDAHAWPELYFEGVGWTRFEPTPTRGSVPDYTVSDTPSDAPSDPAEPEASDPAEPSAEPSTSASQSCTAEMKKLNECGADDPLAAAGGGDDGPPVGTILGAVAGVAALLVLPFLPLLWRTRVRAARLGSGGRTAADTTARTLAAWLEITDTAWDHGIVPDDAQTPRKAAARIVRIGQLDPETAGAVHRVAAAVEQVLYAPEPVPIAGLGDEVRRFRAGLRASVGRRARLRATLAPRSAARVGWAFAERRQSLATRWSGRRWGRLDRWPGALRRTGKQQG